MKMFDNSGKLVAEQNVILTNNGNIVSNTLYDTGTGCVVSQQVSVTDFTKANVRSEIVRNGKILP